MLLWTKDRGRSALVVSYFTDSFYQREAFDMVRSCQRFHLSYRVEQVEDKGGWLQNTNIKPTFIREQSQRFPNRMLVWVDVDARFRKQPGLFGITHPEWAIAFRTTLGGRPASGTLILPPGPKRDQLLDRWIYLVQHNTTSTDQVCLGYAVHQLKISHYELPPEYCWIYDFDEKGREVKDPDPTATSPVIEHLQASRWTRYCPRCGV